MRRRNRDYNSIQLFGFYYNSISSDGIVNDKLTLVDFDYVRNKIINSVPRRIPYHSGKHSKVYNYTSKEKNKFIKLINRERNGVNFGELKIFLFITILLFRVLTEKHKGRNYFKSLCQSYLKDYIYKDDISIIVNLLVAAEVIEVKSYSADKHYCKGFRFNPKLTIVKTLWLDLNCNWLGKSKLVTWLKDRIIPIPNEPHLSKVYLSNYMKLELNPKALAYVKAASYKNEDSKIANITAAETLDSFANKQHANNREYDDLYCRYGTGTGRMYTNISNFSKEFRHFLEYKNKPVVKVDCSSCHPLMLIKHYEEGSSWDNMELEIERNNYYDLFKGGADFYLSIGDLADIKRKRYETDDKYRSRIKNTHYYSFLYDKPHDVNTCRLTKAYAANFPILLDRINYLKLHPVLKPNDEVYGRIIDEPHTQFSFINLRMEGEIMIHGVAKELANLKRPVWFTTIHDCVICQKSNVPLVTKIMKKHFKRVLGVEAYFK